MVPFEPFGFNGVRVGAICVLDSTTVSVEGNNVLCSLISIVNYAYIVFT